MSPRQLRSLILIAATILSASAQLSKETCQQPTFNNINATGSTSFPGFHPNGSVPGFQESTWTLHTGLVDIVVPSDNSSFILQKWWLSTDPVITTPAAEFPFAGCTFLLDFSFYQKLGVPTTGSNTCEHIFNDACQSAIIDMINSNITASGNTTDEGLCASIIDNVVAPSQCKNSMWGGVDVEQPFGNPSFNPNENCNISNSNVFNGSAKTGTLGEIGSFSVPNGNYTWYDEYTKLVTPMIISLWPKNSTTAWEPDTRLFCITASDIETGSRVPSSAMSLQPFRLSLHALGAVVIAAYALL